MGAKIMRVKASGNDLPSGKTPLDLLNEGVFLDRPPGAIVKGEHKCHVLSVKVPTRLLARLNRASELSGEPTPDLLRRIIDDGLYRSGV